MDITELERLAMAAREPDCHYYIEGEGWYSSDEWVKFKNACTPDLILSLVERVKELERENELLGGELANVSP